MIDSMAMKLIINSLNRIEDFNSALDKKIQQQNITIMRHTLALEKGTKEFELLHEAHEKIKDEINFVRKMRIFILFFRPTKKKVLFLIGIITSGTTLILKYDQLIQVLQ